MSCEESRSARRGLTDRIGTFAALHAPGHDLGGVARLELAVDERRVARHRGVKVFRRNVRRIGILDERMNERVVAGIHEERYRETPTAGAVDHAMQGRGEDAV